MAVPWGRVPLAIEAQRVPSVWRGLLRDEHRPQSPRWPLLPPLSAPPAPLLAGCRVSAVGGWAQLGTLGLPICFWWGGGSRGALAQLEHCPWLGPLAGWQWGQVVPLLTLPVPALGSLPVRPLAAAAAAAEPGRDQLPVPGRLFPPCLRIPAGALALEGRRGQAREGAAGAGLRGRLGCGLPLPVMEGRWSLQAKFMNVHHW